MKYISILLFLVCSEGFAQTSKHKNNQILLNAGNETLYVGASYRRSLWLTKSDSSSKHNNHFEVGAGFGWIPVIFQSSNTSPLAVSHSLSYVFGKKYFFGTINYAGIVAPRDRLFNSRFLYTPNPSIGIRLQVYDFMLGINYNAYFYSEESYKIINENELIRNIKSKVAMFPGIYLGLRF